MDPSSSPTVPSTPTSTSDTLSHDVEGPVISVSATIIIALILTGLTIAALYVFIRARRRNAPQNRASSALQCAQPDLEMPPVTVTLPKRAFTFDQALPPYPGKDASDPPEYVKQHPPPAQ